MDVSISLRSLSHDYISRAKIQQNQTCYDDKQSCSHLTSHSVFHVHGILRLACRDEPAKNSTMSSPFEEDDVSIGSLDEAVGQPAPEIAEDDGPEDAAPRYPIPSRYLAAVEIPAVVENIDRAVKAFGRAPSLAHVSVASRRLVLPPSRESDNRLLPGPGSNEELIAVLSEPRKPLLPAHHVTQCEVAQCCAQSHRSQANRAQTKARDRRSLAGRH